MTPDETKAMEAIEALNRALTHDGTGVLREKALHDAAIVARRALLALSAHPDEETVTTVAEFDALPEGTVVLDAEGDVWQYRGGLWCTYETAPCGSERTFRKYGPLRVLYRPTHEGSE